MLKGAFWIIPLSFEHPKLCKKNLWWYLLSLLKAIRSGAPWKHPNVYQNCWCTKIASFENLPELAIRTTIGFGTPLCFVEFQKKPDVRNFSARNSGAGNGRANFMGAWDFGVLSAGKSRMPMKFLLLGGGCGLF